MITEYSRTDIKEQRLKDIPKINKERPCNTCVNYRINSLVHCRLAAGNCNFYHNKYMPSATK